MDKIYKIHAVSLRWIQRVVVISSATIIFSHIPAIAYDFKACDSCHGSRLARDIAKTYQHSPFMDKKCEECHAVQVKSLNPLQKKKTDWFGDSAIVDWNHGFLIPDNQLGDTLVLELKSSSGEFSHHEVTVPPLKETPKVEDNCTEPPLSDVKVLNISRGITLSATVEWQTNCLAGAAVRFGEENVTQTSETNKRLGRQHQVTLRNLAPNKTYRFSAVSTDLFGRQQVSEIMTFSTSVPISTFQPEHAKASPEKLTEQEVNIQFQQLDENYLIEITLLQAAKIFVGSKGEKQPCLPDDEFHTGLSCVEVGFMDACLNCHDKHDHPVNVAPQKEEIIIPDEFPTLPGGKIACTSCHNPHGSNYRHLTRQDELNQLCSSCHKKQAYRTQKTTR